MRDPKRLLSGEGTDLERSLLRAVSAERPTRDLERRMQAALGFKGFSAAKALSTVTQLVVVAALGVVVSSQASSPLLERSPALEAPLPARTVATPNGNGESSSPAERAPQARPAPEEAAPLLDKEPAAEPARTADEDRPRTVASSQRASLVSNAGSAPGLRDEIKLLDRARGALRGGDAARALSQLDRYAQKFPRGDFRQEASVLRIEALEQSGQRSRAATLAREFVSQHPKSPHVERVQRVSGNKASGTR